MPIPLKPQSPNRKTVQVPKPKSSKPFSQPDAHDLTGSKSISHKTLNPEKPKARKPQNLSSPSNYSSSTPPVANLHYCYPRHQLPNYLWTPPSRDSLAKPLDEPLIIGSAGSETLSPKP